MKSTSNMSRGAFEKNWQERFEGAEAEPSKELWVGIEAGIANEEAARFKRGMAFYRWMAAAGVVLIAGLIGYYLVMTPESVQQVTEDFKQEQETEESIAGERSSELSQIPETRESFPVTDVKDNSLGSEADERVLSDNQPALENESEPAAAAVSENPSRLDNLRQSDDSDSDTNGSQVRSSQSTLAENRHSNLAQDSGQNTQSGLYTEQSGLYTEGQQSKSANGFVVEQPLSSVTGKDEILLPPLDKPELPENLIGVVVYPQKRSSSVESKLWAGLNLGSGYFDPNYQTASTQSSFQPGTAGRASGEEHSSGLSMSFGMEMGMQLSERWQLRGGLQYLDNNVQSSTNLVLDNRTPVLNSTIDSDALSDESFNNRNVSYVPTELDNSFQFLSVPVQAGYLIVNTKVKLLLNAGVSSDFFLKNRISAVDQQLESLTISPGSDAPFRSVFFSGLFGAQASYELLPRYVLTLEPRYKLALTDFTRPEVSYTSTPSSFGVGVGIKYVFK